LDTGRGDELQTTSCLSNDRRLVVATEFGGGFPLGAWTCVRTTIVMGSAVFCGIRQQNAWPSHRGATIDWIAARTQLVL
jgi:hypothetical protein